LRIIHELDTLLQQELNSRGYQAISTPSLVKSDLWRQSGHWDFYEQGMYKLEVEEEDYAFKPMNCPESTLVYRFKTRSYRDLPLRFAQDDRLLRNERSGTLNGLLRVRQLTMDDAHIYCRPDQVQDEIRGVLEFQKAIYAFYGPKIDVDIQDALGRPWQLNTTQLDFQMPERFGLEYIGEDGQAHRPVMIHRAIYGTYERFMAVLVEHYAGAFPLWLAPVQAVVVPIADRHLEYAESVAAQLRGAGFRTEVDERRERMQAKLRDAQAQQVPYMLVVGDRDQQ